MTASVRTAGDLAIVADTLPPAIRPLFAEGADLTRAEGVRFRAADNFSGIASWRLHIDGKWVPCDRFPMKGTLVHFFDAPAQRRTHAVRLSVTDGFRRNILPLTNDGFGKNFLYLRELQRNTQ